MNESEYDERRLFWADLTMGLLIIGIVTVGFVVGAWTAFWTLLEGSGS
jgi:hypothetical protein